MWKELHVGLYGNCLPLLEKLASGPLYLFLEISDESAEAKYTYFAPFLPCPACSVDGKKAAATKVIHH